MTEGQRPGTSFLESFSRVFQSLLSSDPTAVAQAVEGLSPVEAEEILRELPVGDLAGVVERLETSAAAQVLERLPVATRSAVFQEMSPRAAAILLRRLSDEARGGAMELAAPETAQRWREALQYPSDTAGGMMELLATTLPGDLTVEQAVGVVRNAPRETLFYLYVVDRERKLIGVLNTRDLLLASPKTRISEMAHRDVVSVPAGMDREEVAQVMRGRHFLALPVVGEDGRLLGVVSHEQVIETVEEEAFEDLQRMVGAGADETTLSPVGTVVARRLPWLCLNLATTFAAAAIVGLFESVIAQVTALAVLLPVVAGQAGNSGAQSLAVVLRGLALDEVAPGTAWRILRKELLAGTLSGLVVAIVTAAGVFFWSGSMGLAAVIGISMWLCLMVSPLVGAGIPLILHRCGLDPAQSATIFLTTFTEVMGFGLFLGLAAVCIEWLA